MIKKTADFTINSFCMFKTNLLVGRLRIRRTSCGECFGKSSTIISSRSVQAIEAFAIAYATAFVNAVSGTLAQIWCRNQNIRISCWS